MAEKKKRIEIKSKWVQGNQIVLNVRLNYDNNVTKDVQSSCPLDMVKNQEQFKAFLEEVWESQKPKTVDLTNVPDSVE
jgi:hypothetical protein